MEPYHSAFLEEQAELDEAQAERDEARRNGKNYEAVATDFDADRSRLVERTKKLEAELGEARAERDAWKAAAIDFATALRAAIAPGRKQAEATEKLRDGNRARSRPPTSPPKIFR